MDSYWLRLVAKMQPSTREAKVEGGILLSQWALVRSPEAGMVVLSFEPLLPFHFCIDMNQAYLGPLDPHLGGKHSPDF